MGVEFSMRRLLKFSRTFAVGVALAACQARGEESVSAPVGSTPAAASNSAARADDDVNSKPLRLPLSRPEIVVEKSARRLSLYAGGEVVRVYRVGLGTAPVGDKERAGDRRTPEGSFYVCVKNPQSAFYLSLGLSYPNAEDAERGLRAGLITRAQYRRIVRAISGNQTPPWDTALGGTIFIHGNGSQSDWTWGCVALDDRDMKELFDSVPTGTPVRIEP
jgi:murein L,D-transpeptidase YafK